MGFASHYARNKSCPEQLGRRVGRAAQCALVTLAVVGRRVNSFGHRCTCIRHCCCTCTRYCLSLSMDRLFPISIRTFQVHRKSYMAFVIDRPRIPHPCKVLQSLQRVLHLFAHKWMCPCCSVGCASHCTHKKPCAEQLGKKSRMCPQCARVTLALVDVESALGES